MLYRGKRPIQTSYAARPATAADRAGSLVHDGYWSRAPLYRVPLLASDYAMRALNQLHVPDPYPSPPSDLNILVGYCGTDSRLGSAAFMGCRVPIWPTT